MGVVLNGGIEVYKLIYGYIHGIDNVRVCDLCNKYNVIMKYDRVVDTYYILGKGTLENTFIDELRAVCSWINLTCMLQNITQKLHIL